MDLKLKYMAEDDAELAVHLAPPGVLSLLKLPKHVGLLAIDAEDKTPCGIAVTSYGRGNRLDIEWISVYETYRNRGVGSELIAGCYEVAIDMKIPSLGFLMEGDLATLEFVEAIRDDIEEFGFYTGIFINGDWNITPKDFDTAFFGKKKVKSRHVLPAEEVDKNLIREYLKKNWNSLKNSPLYDYEKVLNCYDDMFSMVYMTPKGIEGILLVQFEKRILYPLVMDDGGEVEIAMELISGLRRIVSEEEDRYSAHVFSSAHSDELMRAFFGNTGSSPAFLWLADTTYYAYYLMKDFESIDEDILATNAATEYMWLRNDYYGDM